MFFSSQWHCICPWPWMDVHMCLNSPFFCFSVSFVRDSLFITRIHGLWFVLIHHLFCMNKGVFNLVMNMNLWERRWWELIWLRSSTAGYLPTMLSRAVLLFECEILPLVLKDFKIQDQHYRLSCNRVSCVCCFASSMRLNSKITYYKCHVLNDRCKYVQEIDVQSESCLSEWGVSQTFPTLVCVWACSGSWQMESCLSTWHMQCYHCLHPWLILVICNQPCISISLQIKNILGWKKGQSTCWQIREW